MSTPYEGFKIQGVFTNEHAGEQAMSSGSMEAYQAHREGHDGPILIGLMGEDLSRAADSLGTIMVKYSVESGAGESSTESLCAPLLVPAEELEWYNQEYLRSKYGPDSSLYAYAHPMIPNDAESQAVVADTLRTVLDDGSVILIDQYRDNPPLRPEIWTPVDAHDLSPSSSRFSSNGNVYELDGLWGKSRPKRTDVFVGAVDCHNLDGVRPGANIYDAYQQAIEDGDLEVDPANGSSIEAVMSSEDMEHVWDIYKKPFERLSRGNPVLAGFDEDSLKALLADPEIIKVVNRDKGDITTVGLFTFNFERCPWFNTKYYKQNYPEYFNTANILLSPGIVSDGDRRGHTYSWDLVKLLVGALEKRGSNILISFECTEISTRYIPDKVTHRGIEASGLASDRGLEAPVAVIDFKALTKV